MSNSNSNSSSVKEQQERIIEVKTAIDTHLVDVPTLPFRYHFLKEFHKLITTSLGFAAALAWNNAVVAIFNHFYEGSSTNYNALFLFAIIISAIAIVVIVFIGYSAEKIYQADRRITKILASKLHKKKEKDLHIV